MPPRMVPFPLVLIAVTGAFILVALYADVRGREQRAMREQPVVETVNAPIVTAPAPEPAATSTPEVTPTGPQILRLPPEVPASDVPEAAVFDCWRYEWRDDRLIVDRDHRHIYAGIEPLVGSDTKRLRCKDPQYALRSDDESVTVYWSGKEDRATYEPGRPAEIETDTLYRVDPWSGQLTKIATLQELDELTDYALVAFTTDQSGVWLRADSSKSGVSAFYRVSLTGDIRPYAYPQVTSPFFFTPDQTRAIGFQYQEGAVYIHRVNLATGARVRTKQLFTVYAQPFPEPNLRPEFIDDERLLMREDGLAGGAVVLNIFSGEAVVVPQAVGFVELYALSTDGRYFYTFSDQMPLTAIPVSELPKP